MVLGTQTHTLITLIIQRASFIGQFINLFSNQANLQLVEVLDPSSCLRFDPKHRTRLSISFTILARRDSRGATQVAGVGGLLIVGMDEIEYIDFIE